jgi:isopentenyl-diphosphate delta-isomerase
METRKKDHINLASQAQLFEQEVADSFYYEPLLTSNELKALPKSKFLNKELSLPLWVSSMTGGTLEARKINQNLAKACAEFCLGMSLGSCRSLLESNDRFDDFNVRPIMGPDLPFYANLGIAQVEKVIQENQVDKINELIFRLQADGLIVHVNPLQELLQPEGDIYFNPPIETISSLLEKFEFPVIVKEVGQGMGPKSLEALFRLPVAGIEFGALGGTNFSLIELMRSNDLMLEEMGDWATIGHTAFEMVEFINLLPKELVAQKQIIISGGINPLSGFYLKQQLQAPSVMGMAYRFLKYAREDYNQLRNYILMIQKSLQMAQNFLHKI